MSGSAWPEITVFLHLPYSDSYSKVELSERELFVFDYFLSYFDDLTIYELFLEKNDSVLLVF